MVADACLDFWAETGPASSGIPRDREGEEGLLGDAAYCRSGTNGMEDALLDAEKEGCCGGEDSRGEGIAFQKHLKAAEDSQAGLAPVRFFFGNRSKRSMQCDLGCSHVCLASWSQRRVCVGRS